MSCVSEICAERVCNSKADKNLHFSGLGSRWSAYKREMEFSLIVWNSFHAAMFAFAQHSSRSTLNSTAFARECQIMRRVSRDETSSLSKSAIHASPETLSISFPHVTTSKLEKKS